MRQWAILIGLNKYQMFQPLNSAQSDAQALHQLLIHEAGFAPEQCLLLTDTSPPISGRATTPTRANLQSWIELLTQQCFKPGDTLWFFFSGYGVCSQGRDYLVPLDGDPFAVETTCILMSDIFSRLQASLSPGLPLVLFDINRSQANFSNEHVGTQTARLAKQLGVPTILSCQPGQYSRDISGMGHGLFTVALLEALRYHQAATPATLMRFLGDRIPELGAYYYLPNQQSLAFCPPDQLHQPLLRSQLADQWPPDSNGNGHAVSALLSPDADKQPFPAQSPDAIEQVSIPNAPNTNGFTDISYPNGQPFSAATTAPPAATVLSPPVVAAAQGTPVYAPPTRQPPPPASHPLPPVTPSVTSVPANPMLSEPAKSLESTDTDDSWRPLVWGAGLTLLALGLIGSVLWRNWTAIQTPAQSQMPSIAPTSVPTPSQPTNSIQANAASSEITANSAPAATTSPPIPNRVVDFDPNAPTAAVSGQAILQRARQLVMSDQATPYREAIDEAKRIQANDPYYVEAEQDIAAWSQQILDIAQRRGNQGQFDIAIMAADLVPEDDRKRHPQAQNLIAEWCPAVQGQPVNGFSMRRAKEICSQRPL
jgi:hypothetical protein